MLLQLGVPTAAQFAAILISVLFIGAQINSFGQFVKELRFS